jgi:hypothetical protein
MKQSAKDTQDSIQHLRGILAPGDKVYTILNNVSRSGMNRRISVAIGDGKAITNITWHVARALGEPVKNRAGYVQDVGISVGGCGMDMGFHLVYSLSRVLFPDGFAPSKLGIRPVDGKSVNVDIGRGRNAGPLKREEIAELVAKGWKFPGGRNGDQSGWDTDGGYALKQVWL